MRSEPPLVSVIIPTHNRSKILRVAIESALAQTYPNVEVVVVDDGSTDDTAAVVAQYAGRVTYLRQTNQNVAAARNTGIRAASGEYLAFLDDDDLILPTKIERQMQVLVSRPDVRLIHCRYYHIDRDGNLLSKIGPLPTGAVLKRLVCRNFIWAGAPLVRRHCFKQVGLFDEDIPAVCSDWDMWLRIAQAGYPFACVQEPLGAYRVHRDSMLADVPGLEQAVLATLDKTFADPRLPVDVASAKAEAYGKARFRLSFRYYALNRWEDGQRNLGEALALHPSLLEDRGKLFDTLCNEALDERVDDPFKFIDGILDHLPPVADSLRPYRPYLISRVYVGLALRNYGLGRIDDAQHQLADGIALYPAMLERPEDFARTLFDFAMRLPGTPHLYVATVFQNLPPQAQRLEHVQSRVLSDVNIGCAFEDYFAGQRRQAARRILSALQRRPSWLANRGVVSILVQSLPRLLDGA